MRAREADHEGYAEHEGVKIFYEVFGEGEVTLLLVPPWSVVQSRLWKGQIPHLARHYRIVSYDLPGSGRSDRPTDAASFEPRGRLAWATAVLDASETGQVVVVTLSSGIGEALLLAALTPERVEGIVIAGSSMALCEPLPEWRRNWSGVVEGSEGWQKVNRRHMRSDYADFARFFVGQIFPEPHSTKQIEDGVGWALESEPESVIAANDGLGAGDPIEDRAELIDPLLAAVRCPTLVMHGTDDSIGLPVWGEALAERLGAELVLFEGSGHGPMMRDPVKANLLIRDFVDRIHPPAPRRRVWTRAHSRPRRALFISSPIGLGHAQRDVAIARELRQLHPDLQIDWLAQDPVTRVLEANGETIHPASRLLVSESRHMESESSEHDLHCFQAFRRMDEILVSNFHVFDDVVTEDQYDLWVGDEAWEIDYFLHENPELKRAAYCWLTDFVGWLPMPEGGEHEARLTADYNAEMIEQIERFGRIRDRSVFVGNPDDIVPDRFGADLPLIRDWTEQHYDFAGYVTGFDPADVADREALRAELGYRPDQQVCIVTVGGSGVGDALLRRVIEAYPAAKAQVPALRMIVVAGPRIDPQTLPRQEGLEVRAFVPDLYRHLAACDLAVVQGGLTTSMELTANRRPFLYFPLAEHFEQTFLVPYRLDRYRAGRRMDYATDDADTIASAIADTIGREVDYLPVETDGAARAAARLAEML
jgi:pimeloyl-ACP methyl ester carboxylesterase/predicted glycosyltransferase